MTRQQITEMQARVGTLADGWWGPKSIAACQRHLRGMMPTPNPWPAADDRSMVRFYGPAADHGKMSNISVLGLGVKFSGRSVANIYCHHLVQESLRRAIAAVAESGSRWVLGEYAGCFNDRTMRGSGRKSKHAWGVAIDFAARSNGLWTVWPQRANMPLEVMECFAREGWINLGWTVGRDAMHFQATR